MLGSWTSKEISRHDEWTIMHLKLFTDCVPLFFYLGRTPVAFSRDLVLPTMKVKERLRKVQSDLSNLKVIKI